MSEKQNIEWKSSWHDDYLKWICGFANAHGGKIYIGKNNDGEVVGLEDHKKLMDTLPNKIRDQLGIVCEVNLLEEDAKHFIEIITQPYSVPVSLRGRYYYRSGSTKQELTGNSLNEFLLKKAGKTWDNVVDEAASFEDIDQKSVDRFLKDAERSGRMPEEHGLELSDVLDKLRLINNDQLKRAAIILFGKDPNRYYPNIKVKIGSFGADDAELKFQEVMEGNIIQLLIRVPEQLNNKFLRQAHRL
ncbi:MAG: putative DNA binding domain-containing protein [Owenweeksia sp.]|nr:putative DNA binding domain-containing protein [Owenweeksia sp.]